MICPAPTTLIKLTLLLAERVLAQPTLTTGQYGMVPGDVFSFAACAPVPPGGSGPDQTWSFDNVVSNTPSDNTFVDPVSTAGAAYFPTATVTNQPSGISGGQYLASSATEELDLGYFAPVNNVMVCTDPRTIITYPFTYGSTFTDSFVCSETGSFSDRVRTGTTTVTADGYGTLELPYGTFNDCLRIHVVTSYTDVYGQSAVNGYAEIESYLYVRPGIRAPLFSTGSSSYVQGDQTFGGSSSTLLSALSTGVLKERMTGRTLLVYPNPAASAAQVILPSAGGDLAIVDATGRSISVQRTSGTVHSLDLHAMACGAYWLRWAGTDGVISGVRLLKQ